jgi:3-oxoacyl-[acyl-carrier-protein] synthase-3
MKHAGLISMGGYLPAKPLPDALVPGLVEFLRHGTLLPPEYIATIKESGVLPGTIETNYDGWESQPWFEAWLDNLPEKKSADPFQGTTERRRVPLDPDSLRQSIVPHPMLSSDAEVLAGALAMINGGINQDEIDLLLVHSQVPDLSLPTNVSLVQHKLGLKNAGAYAIDTCCSSFVTMMEVAAGMVKAGIKEKVLIISSYLDSHVIDRSEYYSVYTGDSAVAGVVAETGDGTGYIASHASSHGDRHDAIIFDRRPPGLLRTTNSSPDYTQEFTTFHNFTAIKEIANHTQEDMVFVVSEALQKAGLSIEQIAALVTHQPVGWAGNAWREALGVPEEKFYQSFERYGNIATCAAGVNLLEAVETGMLEPGEIALVASSGAGENHIAVLERVSVQLIQNNCSEG